MAPYITAPSFSWLVCLQRALPSWSLKRAAHTITGCSTTESCWTHYRWMPTPMAASSTPRSQWTPTYLHMLPHVYEVRCARVVLYCFVPAASTHALNSLHCQIHLVLDKPLVASRTAIYFLGMDSTKCWQLSTEVSHRAKRVSWRQYRFF